MTEETQETMRTKVFSDTRHLSGLYYQKCTPSSQHYLICRQKGLAVASIKKLPWMDST